MWTNNPILKIPTQRSHDNHNPFKQVNTVAGGEGTPYTSMFILIPCVLFFQKKGHSRTKSSTNPLLWDPAWVKQLPGYPDSGSARNKQILAEALNKVIRKCRQALNTAL